MKKHAFPPVPPVDPLEKIPVVESLVHCREGWGLVKDSGLFHL